MKVWITACVLLFLLVEFYQWAKGFMLPLPLYVLAGAFLAIASNASQRVDFFSWQKNPDVQQVATSIDPPEVLTSQGDPALPATEETAT
jgi:hypothetical protein